MDAQETKKAEKVKKIKEIYREYLGELDGLKEKQQGVISDSVKGVENRKIEEIRNKLKAE